MNLNKWSPGNTVSNWKVLKKLQGRSKGLENCSRNTLSESRKKRNTYINTSLHKTLKPFKKKEETIRKHISAI